MYFKFHFNIFTAQRSSAFFRMHLQTASLCLSSLRSMRKSQYLSLPMPFFILYCNSYKNNLVFFPSSRYARKLAISDLYRLPDVLSVREQGGSRLACLLSNNQIRQSPLGSSQSQEGSSSTNGSPVVFEELEHHEPVCRQHYTEQDFRYKHFLNDMKIMLNVFSFCY